MVSTFDFELYPYCTEKRRYKRAKSKIKGICRLYSPILLLLHIMTNSIRIPFRYSKQLTYDKEKGLQLFILIIISTDSHKEKMAQRRKKGRCYLERSQYKRVAKKQNTVTGQRRHRSLSFWKNSFCKLRILRFGKKEVKKLPFCELCFFKFSKAQKLDFEIFTCKQACYRQGVW